MSQRLYALCMEGCEDPHPMYPRSTGKQETKPLPHPALSSDALVSSPTTPDEASLSALEVVGRVVILHVPAYVFRSLATGAWGARAIEYAVGAGCVASTMMLIKAALLDDTLPECTRAERRFLAALTVALSAGIPGIGYCICSLASDGPVEEREFLMQAFSAVVLPLFVMAAI